MLRCLRFSILKDGHATHVVSRPASGAIASTKILALEISSKSLDSAKPMGVSCWWSGGRIDYTVCQFERPKCQKQTRQKLQPPHFQVKNPSFVCKVYTPPKTNGSPENTLLASEKHRPKPFLGSMLILCKMLPGDVWQLLCSGGVVILQKASVCQKRVLMLSRSLRCRFSWPPVLQPNKNLTCGQDWWVE